jgi:hypothetical protein
MALGGYQGWDRILTPERLATLVSDGVVRFFWINGGGGPGGGSGPGNGPGRGQGVGPGQPDGPGLVSSSQDATGDLLAWVRARCEVVPPDTWQATGSGGRADPRGQQLYDCGAPVGQR